MGCLIAARYKFLTDIYTQTIIQDEGDITHEWNYTTPYAVVKSLVFGVGPGLQEHWGPKYSDTDLIHIVTDKQIDLRFRVGNIRNRKGDLIYDPIAVFDVIGVRPIIDNFGNVIEYDMTAARAQNR
jgi:hypothetical protein